MARHARLTRTPAAQPDDWPWHEARWTSMPLGDLAQGDRRFEAETYLSSGHGLRLAIERQRGWLRLSEFAATWQPLRLKGIQVGPEGGTPFLAATQVFDIRPVPRKWLALGRTEHAATRFVAPGQILVTCSGAVGRATLAHAPHEGMLISHDLLRVDAREPSQRGWLYAYLRAPQTRAMMSGAQYGHIIKHLETAHLDALPVPQVDTVTAEDFERRVVRLLELRNRSYTQTLEAERLFEQAIGPLKIDDTGESGFSVWVSHFTHGRRRFDASNASPVVSAIWNHLKTQGAGFTRLGNAGYQVWVPGRYKRIPADDGVLYFDSADLLEVSPDNAKRFADCGFGDKHRGRVEKNWVLMPCSGQVYGIIGSVVLVGDALDGAVVSNHAIRIAPVKSDIRPGYVLIALSHPLFGRPLVKALAFGSSVPEIDVEAVQDFPIVRLAPAVESGIADCAESSADARAQADALERELSEDAGRLIDRFIASGSLVGMASVHSGTNASLRPVPSLAEHARVRLRVSLAKHHLRAGATGTIVHVYNGGAGLEVEFDASSASPKVVTLERDAIEPVMD